MSEIIRSPINGNAILLVPRSGSHSLALAAVTAWYPDRIVAVDAHPATVLPQEVWRGEAGLGIVVRNPIERFRSMCAHRPERTLENHLACPVYMPLPVGDFARYFRFEDQLNECAEWLGLPTPLPQEDATEEANKPVLTPEQEARVREIYADDIKLWESLQ
jgi:hypothetical protein